MKILLSATLALLLLGCSNEQESSSKEELKQSVQKVVKIVKKEVETTKKKVVQESDAVVKKIVTPLVKKEVTTPKVVKSEKLEKKEPKKIVPKKVVAEKVVVEKKIIKETPKPVVVKIDGAKLFAKCVSCHGQNAEKKALNKSNVIQGWSTDKTIAAINGYKDGSYGSSMKGVMKPQVAKLTKAEVQAVAEYISKL